MWTKSDVLQIRAGPGLGWVCFSEKNVILLTAVFSSILNWYSFEPQGMITEAATDDHTGPPHELITLASFSPTTRTQKDF